MADIVELKKNLELAEQVIKDLKLKIQELEKPKIEKWGPKRGQYAVSGDYNVVVGFPSDDYLNEFTRPNKQLAERAAREMERFNRLLAYRDEFDPEFQTEQVEENWRVHFDKNLRRWDAAIAHNWIITGVVYMSRKCAEELARKLNSGEVEL